MGKLYDFDITICDFKVFNSFFVFTVGFDGRKLVY